MFRLSVGVCRCGYVTCIFCWDSLTLVRTWCFWKYNLLAGEATVWLSFLVVLRRVALSYIKENKTVIDGTWIWGEGKFICLCFILVREDLQNCDEHIALIEMKKCSVWSMCVVVVKTLWRSVSVSMEVNWANDHLVCSGTQFLGVVSRLSISNSSPSVSSFSAKATTCFFGRYRFSVLLRLMIT